MLCALVHRRRQAATASQGDMFSPLTRGAAAAGTVATGLVLSDRDRRDAVRGVTNGAARFARAFGYATLVSYDFKRR